MRRTKLIWFAFGATVAGISSVAVSLWPSHELDGEMVAFLVVDEPWSDNGEVVDTDFIANVTGQIARDCGAQFFETTFLGNDKLPTMELPLISQNSEAFRCLIDESKKRDLGMSLIFRGKTDVHAF